MQNLKAIIKRRLKELRKLGNIKLFMATCVYMLLGNENDNLWRIVK